MSEFGDWEPEDSFVANNEPDPEYVARRLHELRVWLERMAGLEGPNWDQLDEDEEQVAIALAADLTRHLLTTGRDGSALSLHDAQRFLTELPAWSELDAAAQQIALAVVDDTIRWLQVEGTVIA